MPPCGALIVTAKTVPAAYEHVEAQPPVPSIAITMLSPLALCGLADRTSKGTAPTSRMSAASMAESLATDESRPSGAALRAAISSGTGQRPLRRTGICLPGRPPMRNGSFLSSWFIFNGRDMRVPQIDVQSG